MNTDKILAESIAKEYAPKDNSKIVALKKLDNRAKLPSTIFTYTCGIISTLIFGTGMCMAMKVIGGGMIFGIIVGMIGLIGCGVNYPIYKRMLEKGKAKYAYEIVELARQISEQ
jgi:uncharacterized oligopeptide transporter (OPT) family protein